MTESVLIFFHIPKVGGTTLNSILFNNINRDHSWKFCTYEPEKEIQTIYRYARKNGRTLKCITGHMGFGIHELLPTDFQYFVLLREPLGRVESYYYHFCRLPLTIKHDFVGVEKRFDVREAVQWTAGDLVRNKISNQIDNGYTRYLAGTGGRPITISEKTDLDHSDLKRAKDHLEQYFSVIGITEEYNKMLVLLKTYTRINNIFYVKKNKTTKAEKKHVSESDRIIIKHHNELDIELYNHAKQLMEDRFDSAGLKAELEQFEYELKRYQENYISPRDEKICLINEKLAGINPDHRIAVYSCGAHTEKMFEMTRLGDLSIQFILDTYKKEGSFRGYDIINAERINSLSLDTVVVSNFSFQNNICDYLRNKLNYKGNIVTFYDGKDPLAFYEF